MSLKHTKEITDLHYIGLLIRLNLALIQGNSGVMLEIYKNLQAKANNPHYISHKNEYDCLSRLKK